MNTDTQQPAILEHINITVSNPNQTAELETFNHRNYDPGQRFYFYINDNIEIETVCY